MLRAVLLSLFCLLCIFLVGTPLLVYAMISGDTDPVYHAGVFCAGLALRLGGIRLDVQGREKIPSGRAVVFMANHTSNIDPPAIFACLPPVLVLAKQEAFRIPVLGRAMRLRGFVPVDRQNRERAIAAVEQACRRLRAGQSFVVFPEGTRSPDGRLQALKKGGFVMALQAGAPIMPVSMSGASRIMRRGEAVIHPGRIRVTFHDLIPTAGRGVEARDQVIAEVRQALLSGLAEEEWPLDEPAGRPPGASAERD